MKISLQYCIPQQIPLLVGSANDSSSSTPSSGHSHHLPDSFHSHSTLNPNRHSPYFLARRNFTELHEVVMFTLHLLQMEIMKYVNEISSSPPSSVSAAVATPDPLPSPNPLNEEQTNLLEKWPHQRIWSEEIEKELTMDSLHSHDSVADFSSCSHYLPPLSANDMEALWESQEDTRQNSCDGNVGNSLFSQISSNFPIDNPNPIPTRLAPSLPHFPTPIPDSYASHLPSSNPPQQIISPCGSSLPPLAAVPMPIALQFTINSCDNDLLIQGRHGIGSFDVNILSDDLTRISLAVSGQLMNVTFAPVARGSPGNEIEACRIHLDVVSLALGYLQAIQTRSERVGSDDATGDNSRTCAQETETSVHELSPHLFEESSDDPCVP
jgi:hypothetical protein